MPIKRGRTPSPIIKSVTETRFNMKATLLSQYDHVPTQIDPEAYGEYVESQDPLTGEIVRVWKPFVKFPNNPDTPDIDETRYQEIDCLVRGIVDGGIRVAGTTERFGDTYQNIDYAKMWVPPHVKITKRDRMTNLKDVSGAVRWLDEEFADPEVLVPPVATTFNVNGVTPLYDAFNNHVESFILLERAEVGSLT